jgi:hypothetical protein
MSDVTVQSENTEVTVPPIQQPVHAAPPSASDLPEELPKGVLQIPSSAMGEIRRKERERGQKSQMKRLDDQAKTLGYKSHDDMIQQISAQRARGGKGGKPNQARSPQPVSRAPEAQPPATATGTNPASKAPEARVERRDHRRDEQLASAQRKAAQERAKRKQLEREVQAAKAEGILRQAAVRAGVQDIDYSLHLLKVHVRKLDQKGLRTFDEEKYFTETLRQSHPHLFGGAAPVPATTGPSGAPDPSRGGPPAIPPANGNPATPPANGGKGVRDARTMTSEQVSARLRELGLANPNSSMPV